ncbi:MAG: discoidin domain-containing protein, partial [Planctomycetes bacterium]|nr:discoidin domain-containing protein [Planctomycetota bacterium]
MKNAAKTLPVTRLFLTIGLLICLGSLAAAEDLPVNLAARAKVSASSQFSRGYRPAMAINNVIPSEFTQDQDWAVQNAQTGWFMLEWDQPIEAAQIIYYARVTSPLVECFKAYEVYLNDAGTAAVTGMLEHRHGAQMINFPKQTVTKIRLVFLSSHPDSPNPGAAEIAVYGTPVTGKQLSDMRTPPEEKTPEAKALRQELLAGELGFSELLLVKRKPLNISHVYVYHVEGFRPGGGLYRFTPNENGGELVCIFDAGDGMITTADLSYDGREVVFAMRRGGLVASNPVAHIEDISRHEDEQSN